MTSIDSHSFPASPVPTLPACWPVDAEGNECSRQTDAEIARHHQVPLDKLALQVGAHACGVHGIPVPTYLHARPAIVYSS